MNGDKVIHLPPDRTVALRFANISCEFSQRNGHGTYCAVQNTTLNISDGEFVSVVGPTGCGKSTLLNVAAGLFRPSSGATYVYGEELTGINREAGYMFQAESLLPWKNALDNVIAGCIFRGEAPAQARERGREWLRKVGLDGCAERYPHQLSGGMRKRVALAQMLITEPRIILMDEPFSALDVQTRHLMENELLDIWSSSKRSVLFVTHDLEEAIAMSDRVVVLAAGPGTHPIAEYTIDLPRPRDVNEIRLTPQFQHIHSEIWNRMRAEVHKGYQQTRRTA